MHLQSIKWNILEKNGLWGDETGRRGTLFAYYPFAEGCVGSNPTPRASLGTVFIFCADFDVLVDLSGTLSQNIQFPICLLTNHLNITWQNCR